MECYDEELAVRLDNHIHESISVSHLVTLQEMDSRSIPKRLRDGFARLFAPIL